MKVLMVTDGLWNGGLERQLTLLASSLPEPWLVSVLSMEDGPFRTALERSGVDLRLAPRHFRLDITAAVRMWRIASDIDPDIVHSWGWMSTLAMAPFCRAHNVPLLNGAARRGYLPPERALLERLGILLSNAVVANSQAGLEAYGAAKSGRGRVVYNGFDSARLERIDAAASDVPPHEGTVAIMAARMSKGKDWRLFFEAARVLAEDSAGWKFVAVGNGPRRDEIVAQAADLVEAGLVEFRQGGLEVLPLVEAADIGVLLSDPRAHSEGCSNSIMEYMACGLPVVCTDAGGNPELVESEVTGVLVPPGDLDQVVTALRMLCLESERAREMGRQGRLRLETDFTVASMVDGFLKAYKSILS